MVDILSNGRLELGVGRGGSVRENKGFKAPTDHSRERFKEAIDIIIGAWTAESLTYRGDHYQIEDLRIFPKPLQKPRPVVYVASVSPESFDWVGRLGLPFCYVGATWEPVEKGTFQLQQQWYEDAASLPADLYMGISRAGGPGWVLSLRPPNNPEVGRLGEVVQLQGQRAALGSSTQEVAPLGARLVGVPNRTVGSLDTRPLSRRAVGHCISDKVLRANVRRNTRVR